MSGQSSQRTARQRPDLRDFRIPVHGHTHPRNGGALADGVGGGGSGGGGGGTGSILAVTDGTTTVSPASEVDFTSGATVTDLGGGIAGVAIASATPVVTDGVVTVNPATLLTVPLGGVTDLGSANAGFNFLTNTHGEQSLIVTDLTVTGTYAFDLSLGNWFDLTLTGNVTSSTIVNPPPAGGEFYIILRKTTGTETFVFPASFVWQAADGTNTGTPPTLHTVATALNVIGAATADGGTTWGAADEGSAISQLTTKGDLLGYSTTTTRVPVGTDGQVLTADSTAALGLNYQTPSSIGPQHVHVDNVVFSGDGATTVFILPAAPVDAYSIAVYVTASRSQDWTLSGALLDTLTFGAAPASAANNIVIDIAAAVV